jgi:hypothetical protein
MSEASRCLDVQTGRPDGNRSLKRGPAKARRLRAARLGTLIALALGATLTAIGPEVLVSVDAMPAHLAGRFREPRGFAQASAGHFLVFDRRAHAVVGVDEAMTSAYTVVDIGAEPGHIIGPTAFGIAADGSFVVADAPRGQGRVQVFSSAGQLLSAFLLPGPARTRLLIDGFAASGVAALHYTGRSVLISQPEYGGLITEYSLTGRLIRSFGEPRTTGHENDTDVHLALNNGLIMPTPDGGCYFVFQAGQPAFRKYDAEGRLQFERRVQGPEIDSVVASLPDRWPRGADEQPMIPPTVRAAVVDAAGQLWISFSIPFTYVFDRDGDKVRVVQFRAAGVVSPSSLTLGTNGRLLVTPGLVMFDPAIVSTVPATTTTLEPIIMRPQTPAAGGQR